MNRYYRTLSTQKRAVKEVQKAVYKGLLKKKPCQEHGCNSIKVHAHHYNGYEPDNWLKVKWYCREHHHKHHLTKNTILRNRLIYRLYHHHGIIKETLEWMFKLKISTIELIIRDKKNNKIIKANRQ